jgi:hypothetical protein
MDALHTHLLRPPTKIGIIGSGCSQATEPTAEISHYYNLTHVSTNTILNFIISKGLKEKRAYKKLCRHE